MKGTAQYELMEKKLLSLIVVAGISFSAISISMFDYEFDDIQSHLQINANVQELCISDICNVATTKTETVGSFVQQGEVISSDGTVITSTEDFTGITIPKTSIATKDYTLSGNKATLFAEKDGFIREGIKNANEGSNEILRVMGTDETNNRALIAFNQADIEAATAGKTLQSATLKLYVESTDGKWADGQLVNIHRLQSNWHEGVGINIPFDLVKNMGNGATWHCSTEINCDTKWNGGSFELNPTDSVFISNQVMESYWIKFDVTNDVQNYLSGSDNFGWIIMKSDEDASGRINFAAREAQSNTPELVLVLTK